MIRYTLNVLLTNDIVQRSNEIRQNTTKYHVTSDCPVAQSLSNYLEDYIALVGYSVTQFRRISDNSLVLGIINSDEVRKFITDYDISCFQENPTTLLDTELILKIPISVSEYRKLKTIFLPEFHEILFSAVDL